MNKKTTTFEDLKEKLNELANLGEYTESDLKTMDMINNILGDMQKRKEEELKAKEAELAKESEELEKYSYYTPEQIRDLVKECEKYIECYEFLKKEKEANQYVTKRDVINTIRQMYHNSNFRLTEQKNSPFGTIVYKLGNGVPCDNLIKAILKLN